MRTQLSMVGDGWAVTMLGDRAGWLVEDASQISRSGRVQAVASRPLGRRRFPTRSGALAASAVWLREQGILAERQQ